MHLSFLILLSLLLQQFAAAEVFKCVGKHDDVSYQNMPCNTAAKQQALDIKPDSAKEAAAKDKLEQVHGEYKTRKATQMEAEKQAAEQNQKAAKLEVARLNALAKQELAAAKHSQAQAKKQQRHRQHKPVRKATKPVRR